jgi:chemotaxis protein CheX
MEQYIQPFIKVCTSVFKDMLHCDLITEKVFFVEKEAFNNWDISGVIGLSGEAKGAVAISMKTETAIKLTEILTGIKHEYMDSDVVDAVGELVNIIAGNVKKDLEEMFRLVISLPTIVRGKAHLIVWPSVRTRIFCIPFKIFSEEALCLSVAIDKQS